MDINKVALGFVVWLCTRLWNGCWLFTRCFYVIEEDTNVPVPGRQKWVSVREKLFLLGEMKICFHKGIEK
jgi:hypothetical protein